MTVNIRKAVWYNTLVLYPALVAFYRIDQEKSKAWQLMIPSM